MIDCLTNLLLLVNLKKKNQLSLSQSADKQEPRTGNIPPVPNRKCASDMDDQRILKTHYLTNGKAMLAKCPLSLMNCFKSNKLRISVNELYKIS